MGQYDDLDAMILGRIGESANGVSFTEMLWGAGMVAQECKRLATLTGRYRDRVLDGRLQHLRKQSKIQFSSKWGWQLLTK